MKRIWLYGTALLLLFVGCEKEQISYTPIPVSREHTCALDGMVLADYDGPKGQIVWKDGQRTFYCDVREAMFSWANPIEKNRIQELYVQDFSGVEWGAYPDRWEKVSDVSLVIDSAQKGAMGVSYVPFSVRDDAVKFQQEFGGKIVTVADITEQTLAHSSKVQQEQLEKDPMQPMHHKH